MKEDKCQAHKNPHMSTGFSHQAGRNKPAQANPPVLFFHLSPHLNFSLFICRTCAFGPGKARLLPSMRYA